MDSKSLQGVMSHIHSESFDRFCMGKLSIDFVVILPPSRRPPTKSTKDPNFPQGMMTHTHSKGFDRFFMGMQICLHFVHLVILAPNMHDQTNLPQNQQWTPTFLRAWRSTPIPRVFRGGAPSSSSSFLAHLVILPPNMHDQDDLPQNQQRTPTSFRVCLSTPIPRVFRGGAPSSSSSFLAHLVILVHHQTWPPSKSTMDSKSLQGVMSHIHSWEFWPVLHG